MHAFSLPKAMEKAYIIARSNAGAERYFAPKRDHGTSIRMFWNDRHSRLLKEEP